MKVTIPSVELADPGGFRRRKVVRYALVWFGASIVGWEVVELFRPLIVDLVRVVRPSQWLDNSRCGYQPAFLAGGMGTWLIVAGHAFGMALAQGLVLKWLGRCVRVVWWIMLTAGGVLVGYGVILVIGGTGFGPRRSAVVYAGALCQGLLVGIGQWAWLRSRSRLARYWIIAVVAEYLLSEAAWSWPGLILRAFDSKGWPNPIAWILAVLSAVTPYIGTSGLMGGILSRPARYGSRRKRIDGDHATGPEMDATASATVRG